MGIRVAIVNDYEVVVRGLATMLRHYEDEFDIVELNADTSVAQGVDIALYDTFAQPPADREGVAELVANPLVGRVVVYSWNYNDRVAKASLARGASAYVSKTLPARQLAEALRRVHIGESVVTTSPPGSTVTGGDWPGREEGLTIRESEVLALITQGLSNDQIADVMALSINSIKSYIRSCYRKIGVQNRSNAILWGVQHGFGPDRLRISSPDTA